MFKFFNLIRSIGLKNFVRKAFIYGYRKFGIQKLFAKYYDYSTGLGRESDNLQFEWDRIPFLSSKSINKVSEYVLRMSDDLKQKVTKECDNILSKKLLLFSFHRIHFDKIDFNFDPLENVYWENGDHFSAYSQFDPKRGDIKRVWELNRFQFLDCLLVGFILSDDNRKDKIQSFFIHILDKWMIQNPHDRSVAWGCSQEISIRSIKLIFLFRYLQIQDKEITKKIRNLLILSAQHVNREINYAKTQRNNHAITESVFLMIYGLLFDDGDFSKKVYKKGLNTLNYCITDQFFNDGTYIQNSYTYQRFALQSLSLAYQINNDEFLLKTLGDVFEKSNVFLYNSIIDDKGDFPNYGPNDGALLYNWSLTDYRDMRPIINILSTLSNKCSVYNEDNLLLDTIIVTGGTIFDKCITKPEVKDSFETTGYYFLKNQFYSIFFRCGNYRGRFPSQNDMLHVDIWKNKKPLIIDAGTYEYFGKSGVENFHKYLSTSAHNTIRIGNLEQLDKGPRFTWLSSVDAELNLIDENKIEGTSHAYKGRIGGDPIHRRTISINEHSIEIVDDLKNVKGREIELFWHTTEDEKFENVINGYYLKKNKTILTFDLREKYTIEQFLQGHSLYYAQNDENWSIRLSCITTENDLIIKTMIK